MTQMLAVMQYGILPIEASAGLAVVFPLYGYYRTCRKWRARARKRFWFNAIRELYGISRAPSIQLLGRRAWITVKVGSKEVPRGFVGKPIGGTSPHARAHMKPHTFVVSRHGRVDRKALG